MRLTWVSGDKEPQQVRYGDGKSEISQVTTFTQKDMSGTFSSYIIIFYFILYHYIIFSSKKDYKFKSN